MRIRPAARLRRAVPAEAGVPSRTCHQAGEKPSRFSRRFPRPFYSLAVQPAVGRSNQMWTCPCADGVLVLREQPARRGAVRAAGGGDRHQVVAEAALGGETRVVVHRLDDPAVVSRPQPGKPLLVGGAGLRSPHMDRVGRLVEREFGERPEAVAHPPGGEQHRPPAGLLGRLADRLPHRQEVGRGSRLAAAHRDHPLAAPEVVEQVDRRVVDGEVGILRSVRRLSEAVRRGLGGVGQFGISRIVVGNSRHPAGQFVRGVTAVAARLRGEQVLHGARPVGVEDDERLGLELVEHLVPEAAEPGNEADLLALVQLPAGLLGQHDRGDVGEEAEADNRHFRYS